MIKEEENTILGPVLSAPERYHSPRSYKALHALLRTILSISYYGVQYYGVQSDLLLLPLPTTSPTIVYPVHGYLLLRAFTTYMYIDIFLNFPYLIYLCVPSPL